MRKAKDGDRVEVEYRGELDCGSVFADSKDSGPIELIIGEDTILSDMGTAVIGMEAGDQKSVALDSSRAFGPQRQELVRQVERSFFTTEKERTVGAFVYLKSQNNETKYRVTAVSRSHVTLDANHPWPARTLRSRFA